jgi:NADH-quinone oxidoreductase subunit D
MELGFGPRHPALQGVLRLKLTVDDERIVECRPVIGHLHRGLEKVFEAHSFSENVAHAGSLDLLAPVSCRLAYVGAVEKLLRIAPPPRARFLRTALAELQRIASHLHGLSSQAADLGFEAASGRARRARRPFLDLLQGLEMTPGGLAGEPAAGWLERCRAAAEGLEPEIDGIAGLLTENRLWKKRTVGAGALSPELALDLGVTGPALRACGVSWDLRRAFPCEAWEEVEFEVPLGTNGDAYDRYRVRLEEMRQSARIVVQCLDRIPEGPVLAILPPTLSAPRETEVYHAVEGPRGEVSFYVVGDGPRPYRCHLRAPSFAHLQALPELCRGELVADLITLVGTLEIALGEADR